MEWKSSLYEAAAWSRVCFPCPPHPPADLMGLVPQLGGGVMERLVTRLLGTLWGPREALGQRDSFIPITGAKLGWGGLPCAQAH